MKKERSVAIKLGRKGQNLQRTRRTLRGQSGNQRAPSSMWLLVSCDT